MIEAIRMSSLCVSHFAIHFDATKKNVLINWCSFVSDKRPNKI